MNPGELLAKVTARAAPFEHAICGFGRFTQEDILHSLGLIKHSGATLLLRVKYCGQSQFLQDLDIRFWMAVGDVALTERWPYPIKFKGKEFYRNMGRMALSENVNPNICLECGGTGLFISPQGKLMDCQECGGSGKSRNSDRSRARLIGMPWQTWNNTWQERYRSIQDIVDKWESIGLGGIRKRLKIA